eukprot:CAMPEP_0114346950 /NCGR_PEP_ID=MMETSP0101-20121206/13493_1 /TAXON_ID=38822 ORGANISM="Pteridomonas danica, Strain PT" /NCGR_SAMPLE_ID=MMETSP0101 /ASSEMBLY_ACC=CAM_ASM_000211 /LENGTH=1385 /DNA_ID=CAMNT_0001483933 /DNA_START=329 /DNA_END=4486 /DNA_ORIENTATION=-
MTNSHEQEEQQKEEEEKELVKSIDGDKEQDNHDLNSFSKQENKKIIPSNNQQPNQYHDHHIKRRMSTVEETGILSRFFGGRGGGNSGGPPIPNSDIPLGFKDDLEIFSPKQVRESHRQLFEDLPSHFARGYKNPCWMTSPPPSSSKGSINENKNMIGDHYRGGRGQRKHLLSTSATSTSLTSYHNLQQPHHNEDEDEDDGDGDNHERFPLLSQIRNETHSSKNRRSLLRLQTQRQRPHEPPRRFGKHFEEDDDDVPLQCLPYAYLLGMPKCGSSDLWERLSRHPQVYNADRKEVRFFTPGEFASSSPSVKGFMPPDLSLSSFTKHHKHASNDLFHDYETNGGSSDGIIVDGGPHTLWWSVQDPSGLSPRLVKDDIITDSGNRKEGRHDGGVVDGEIEGRLKKTHEERILQIKEKFNIGHHSHHNHIHPFPEEEEEETGEGEGKEEGVAPAPIHYLLGLLQPQAKLVVTLAEPVRRMYSDYYFLLTNGVAMGTSEEGKTPEAFDVMATEQVNLMHACFAAQSNNPTLTQADYVKDPSKLPVEAEQACAYDRAHFGRPGTGRINIGIYHAFLYKWFEVYDRNQFKIIRLEDFNDNPKQHLANVFDWLGLSDISETDWEHILVDRTFNEHRNARPSMLNQTQMMLKDFYEPFNKRLVQLLLPGGTQHIVKWKHQFDHAPSSSSSSSSSRRDESYDSNLSGDEDAIKFLWEDVWAKNNANKPIMRSLWENDREFSVLQAHDLHDPKKNSWSKHDNSGGFDPDMPRHPPPLTDIDDRYKKREKFKLRGGDPAAVGDRRKGGGGGRVDRKEALMFEGGRNDLMNLNHDLLIKNQGATALCLASMGLHKQALMHFLSTSGVSASSSMKEDKDRNPLHCLSCLWVFGDSLRESMLTHLLGGKNMVHKEDHWMEQLLDPPIQHNLDSYSIFHITNGTARIAAEMATILIEHGADPSAQDSDGRTPLHLAALGGLDAVAQVLLAHGSDVHLLEERYNQTPLHVCATHGHAKIASLLIKAGADAYLKDINGNSFYDIATAFGSAISESDLKTYLGWEKQPQRLLSPESAKAMYVKHGNGGWRTESLSTPLAELDYSVDPKCSVDMINGSIITSEEILNKYMMMNRPVLIRGLADHSPAWKAYSMTHLRKDHGDLPIHVSDIPYNEKFGSLNGVDESLEKYIDEMVNKKGPTNLEHPWYAFKGHPVPRKDTEYESLVPIEDMPIPRVIADTFERYRRRAPKGSKSLFEGLLGSSNTDDQTNEDVQREYRSAFVNMQWALGTMGSGAPVHFHNVAWNQLFYGRKHWYILPPRTTLMGKKQVLDWVENDIETLEKEGFHILECTQQQGDILIIPEMWGHAVLNTQDSIAVASELAANLYRIPVPKVYKDLTNLPEKQPI